MQLSSVISALEYEAITAMAHARATSDYVDVVVHAERARRWKAMAAAVRKTLDRSAYEAAPPVAKPRKAAPKAKAMGAFEFWDLHGQAVTAIRAVYGDRWRVAAPFGETALVTLPANLCSGKTERGTTIRWPRDGRMPAAQYWPGGKLPDGAVITPDYPRAAALPMIRKGVAWVHDPSANPKRDADWHKAHGYAWDGKEWVFELGLRANQVHLQAIEDYQAQKAALPFADIDDDVLLSARILLRPHHAAGVADLG